MDDSPIYQNIQNHHDPQNTLSVDLDKRRWRRQTILQNVHNGLFSSPFYLHPISFHYLKVSIKDMGQEHEIDKTIM